MTGIRALVALSALVVSLMAAEWKDVGNTSQGNRVYVRDVKGKGEMRSAWIRIVNAKPLKTAAGDVRSSRAKVRVNCTDLTMAAEETIMYIDEGINQIAAQKKLKNEPFNKEPAGSFGDIAVKAICVK